MKKNWFLSAVLLSLSACADLPSEEPQIETIQEDAGIKKIEQASYTKVWPTSVWVSPNVTSYSFVNWIGGTFTYNLVGDPGSGASAASFQFAGESSWYLYIFAHANSCTHSGNGFQCDTAYVPCPSVNFAKVPSSLYFSPNILYSTGWHSWSQWNPPLFQVYFGGTPVQTNYTDITGTPTNWLLRCNIPSSIPYITYYNYN